MKSQVLLTVWCNISGGAGGEIWHWSLSGVKGLSSLEFDWAQIFAQLEPRFPPFGHLSQLKPTFAKLFCYCYVTTRSHSDNNWLAIIGGIIWPPADASLDFVTWLKLAWVGSAVWPGLNPFTPKFKKYILPTFLKRNVWAREWELVVQSSFIWVSYEKTSSPYCVM